MKRIFALFLLLAAPAMAQQIGPVSVKPQVCGFKITTDCTPWWGLAVGNGLTTSPMKFSVDAHQPIELELGGLSDEASTHTLVLVAMYKDPVYPVPGAMGGTQRREIGKHVTKDIVGLFAPDLPPAHVAKLRAKMRAAIQAAVPPEKFDEALGVIFAALISWRAEIDAEARAKAEAEALARVREQMAGVDVLR